MDSDFRTRRGRLRGFSINRLIPNVLTLAALCAGLTAIRFALQGADEARRHRHHRRGDLRCARRPRRAAAGRHQPVRRRARFAVRFPLLRRDAGAGPLHVVAEGCRRAGLGRHPDVPDVLGAAAGALQHGAGFRHAAARLDRLLFHRRAGAGRRAAGADSADGELRDRGSLAAPSAGRRRGAGRWSAA